MMKTMTVAVLCACLFGCARKPDANEQDPLGGPEMRKSASGAADLGWQYFNKGVKLIEKPKNSEQGGGEVRR